MEQLHLTKLPPFRFFRFLRIFLVASFVCLTAINLAGSLGTAFAADGPGGNVSDPVVRAVDIAKPAVVRIITSLGGHLAVHFSSTNTVNFPQNNVNGYAIGQSGSGTFISAHGDILTADHVVNPLRDQQLSYNLDQLAAADVANYYNQNVASNSQKLTADQVLQSLQSGQLPSTASYDKASSEVFLSTDYTGPLAAANLSEVPPGIHATVDAIKGESSFNQKDVAIIHVNMNDMPSVQLGDSMTVQQQDHLRILGFPGNGDVSNKPTDLLTLSVNEVIVSSIKTTNSGAPVIQVGGNVEHGDSGGPALDSQGNVVGIVSFGIIGQGSTSFLQASNSARDLLQGLNIDTTPGTFQKSWNQAFMDYSSTTTGHWHKALQDFQNLAKAYPQFKSVQPYLLYSQKQAQTEQGSLTPTQTSTSTQTTTPVQTGTQPANSVVAYLWTIGGAGVIIILVVILVRVAVRPKTKKKSAGIPVIPQSPPVATPALMQQQNPGRFVAPGQVAQSIADDDGMSAFGAPARIATTLPSVPVVPSTPSGALRPWPCGHMNRSTARYCSICGEPAPPAPTIRS